MQVVIPAIKRAKVITDRIEWGPLTQVVREIFSEEVTFGLRLEEPAGAL